MNNLFIEGLQGGMSKQAAGAEDLARKLLDGTLSASRQVRPAGRLDDALNAVVNFGLIPRNMYRGAKNVFRRRGSIDDGGLREAKRVLDGSRGGLGAEISASRKNILNEAHKRIGTSALTGAGVGGAAGAATAEEGQGAGGFLRGAALGGLGGGMLGGRSANKIRSQVTEAMSGAGVQKGRSGLKDFLNMGDLNKVIDGTTYNPSRAAVNNRVSDALDLSKSLRSIADDASRQAFNPMGAAVAGGGAGVLGTVGYNVGQRKLQQMGDRPRAEGQQQMPQRPPLPPMQRMAPPMMPPRPMMPMMPPPAFGYYPYGGR